MLPRRQVTESPLLSVRSIFHMCITSLASSRKQPESLEEERQVGMARLSSSLSATHEGQPRSCREGDSSSRNCNAGRFHLLCVPIFIHNQCPGQDGDRL